MNNQSFFSTERFESICFKMLMIITVFNIFFPGIGLNSVVSILIPLYLVFTILLLLLRLYLNNGNVDAKIALSYLLVLVFSIFSVILTGKAFSFSYWRKWLMYLSTITFFVWALMTEFRESMLLTIKIVTWIISGLFIIFGFTGRTYPLGDVGITFNLGNPNFAGMWLLVIALLMICVLPYYENRKMILPTLVLEVFLSYFIFLTNARACIISLLVGVVMVIFAKNRYISSFTYLGIIISTLFPLIYLSIVNTKWFNNMFAFAVSEGKGLASRIEIWTRAYEIFKRWPLFGNYYEATEGTGMGQLHSVFVDTLAAYGLIGVILLYSILLFVIHKIQKYARQRGNFIGVYLFSAMLISTTFEASLTAGAQGMFVLAGSLILLTKPVYRDSVEIKLRHNVGV